MGTGEIVHAEYLTRKRKIINAYKGAKGWESMSGHGEGLFLFDESSTPQSCVLPVGALSEHFILKD